MITLNIICRKAILYALFTFLEAVMEKNHNSSNPNSSKYPLMSHRKHDTFGGSVVVDFLLIVTPIVGVCNCSMFCCTLLYVHSRIAIILMGDERAGCFA